MSVFPVAAVLLSLAAGFAWVNHKLLRLPVTIGLMALSLLTALLVLALGDVAPDAAAPLERLIASVDFNQTLMQGMLGYLLFAGALHVDLGRLRDQTLIVGLLATAGVLATTVLVGLAAFGVTRLLGLDTPLLYCLVFGALIAPTDPIAVLAILKEAGAPKSIETKLAGESLFNDGIGVVVFLALAGLAAGHDPHATGDAHTPGVGLLILEEIGGGLALGAALGLLLFVLLRTIDDYKTEVLLTLAGVTGGYALANHLHLSGPLAMVVAGLFIGNTGRDLAMSTTTTRRLDEFWELIDEVLNAVLFVLIGLEVLVITLRPEYLLAGLAMVPLTLLARAVSVGTSVQLLKRSRTFTPGATAVLTWAGLRGGISVALALSLKGRLGDEHAAAADLIVTMTYVVVAFSILVQGLTVGPLLRRLGLAGASAAGREH